MCFSQFRDSELNYNLRIKNKRKKRSFAISYRRFICIPIDSNLID